MLDRDRWRWCSIGFLAKASAMDSTALVDRMLPSPYPCREGNTNNPFVSSHSRFRFGFKSTLLWKTETKFAKDEQEYLQMFVATMRQCTTTESSDMNALCASKYTMQVCKGVISHWIESLATSFGGYSTSRCQHPPLRCTVVVVTCCFLPF